LQVSTRSKVLTWKLKYVGLELVLSPPFHWILKIELITIRLRLNWIKCKIALIFYFEYDLIDELHYLMAWIHGFWYKLVLFYVVLLIATRFCSWTNVKQLQIVSNWWWSFRISNLTLYVLFMGLTKLT
jgi:hypothetical protein